LSVLLIFYDYEEVNEKVALFIADSAFTKVDRMFSLRGISKTCKIGAHRLKHKMRKRMFWIGLYAEGSESRWAQISRKKGKVHIDLLQGGDVKPLYKEDEALVTTGLKASEVLLRDLELKIVDKRALMQSLPFQIEGQIPYDPKEARVSVQVFKKSSTKSSKVFFYAAKEESVKAHRQAWQDKGCEPDEVSCLFSALVRFVRFCFPDLRKALIIHAGESGGAVIGWEEQEILLTSSCSLGTDKALFERDLLRAMAYFSKKLERPVEEVWEEVVFTGSFSPLMKTWALELFPSLLPKECPSKDGYDGETLSTYAPSIGLALEGSLCDGRSVSFLGGELTAAPLERKKKKWMASFALASLGLALGVIGSFSVAFLVKKKSLFQQFSSFEEVQSLEELEVKLSKLEVSLKKEKTPYPLTPPFLPVSGIVEWISNHPLLRQEKADIKKLQYHLEKYPRLGSTKVLYAAKVELAVEFLHLKSAEEFKTSLQACPLIDGKKGVTWKTEGTSYELSFFLKPYKGGLF